ncbi:hypothetical protein FHY05_001848 [Sphingomonas sp. BK580]|nr:hypothetical protein [Sphingomonas sp. BK580]
MRREVIEQALAIVGVGAMPSLFPTRRLVR